MSRGNLESSPIHREDDSAAKEVMRVIFNSPSLKEAFLGRSGRNILVDFRGRGIIPSFSDQGDYIWFILGNKPCVTIGDQAFSDKLFEAAHSVRPQVKRSDALIRDPKTEELVISEGMILYDPSLVRKKITENLDILKELGFTDLVLNECDQFVNQAYSLGTDILKEEDIHCIEGILFGYPTTDAMLLALKINPDLYSRYMPLLRRRGIDLGAKEVNKVKRRFEKVQLYDSVETGWQTFGLTEESKQLSAEIKGRIKTSGILELINESRKKTEGARKPIGILRSRFLGPKIKVIQYDE